MNGFFFSLLLLVGAGWMPVADRDKSGTTGCEKREEFVKSLENQTVEDVQNNLAERQGFEPWSPCGLPVFKTGAIDHSATSPVNR